MFTIHEIAQLLKYPDGIVAQAVSKMAMRPHSFRQNNSCGINGLYSIGQIEKIKQYFVRHKYNRERKSCWTCYWRTRDFSKCPDCEVGFTRWKSNE